MSEAIATPLSKKILRLVLVFLVLTGLFFALRAVKDPDQRKHALEWIKSLGVWAPIVFIAVYLLAVICFVPASFLTAGAGVMFGMMWGSLYVLVAATIAANLTFLLGRYLARNWIAHKLADNVRFKALDEAVAREGWKIVALVRLAPVFPFSLSSYGFGLTRVSLWHYFLASFAMIPGTVMYVYLGVLVGDLAGISRGVKPPSWLIYVVGPLVVVLVLYITRFAKRALSQRIS